MSQFVVDASVAVKWLLPEVHHEAARRLIGGAHTLLAPDLLFLEVGNALWKRVGRGQVTLAGALGAFETLEALGLHVYASRLFARAAVAIAARVDRSVYDSVYVAVAIAQQCPMVTADRKLYEALGRRLPGHVLWVEDASADAG